MRRERGAAYQFGAYRLDVAEQRLLRDGRVLPLTPKVFDVLRVLVENSGHLVEKDTLLAEVWNGSSVEEGALSRAISVLRKTLGENGPEREYIETVPKRGYRFVAPVTCAQPLVPPPPLVLDRGETATTRRRAMLWAIALMAVLGLALLPAMLGRDKRGASAMTRPAPLHRQVTFTGKEEGPTISPDGKRIAYVSSGRPEKKLVVQELAGGRPVTIFTAPEIGYLRWSPNGAELIVWARGSRKGGVYVLPQLGGAARPIADDEFVGCWSPDGSTIAIGGYKGAIRFFTAGGRELRHVALRNPAWSVWDIDWSVNGLLTFVTSDEQGHYSVWKMQAEGGEPRRLVDADTEIPTARWSQRGDAIYYLRRVNQTFSLLKIAVPAGADAAAATPTTVFAGVESDRFFALSDDRTRLVYARAPYHSNLWLVEAGNGSHRATATRELTHGTSLVDRPRVSPDGTTIAFNGGYEPATNVYTMPIAGGTPTQITSLDALSLAPVWSADGRQIAFASRAGGQPGVWVVAANGGAPHMVSSAEMSDTFDVVWSPGARILYQQPGNRNYYQLDPNTRSERLVFPSGSAGWMFSPVYSPDGARIAVAWNRPPTPGIWVFDPRARHERFVRGTQAAELTPIGWSADGGSVYVREAKGLNFRGLTAPSGGTVTAARILRLPMNGAAAHVVVNLPFDEIGGIGMTRDGRRFVVAVYSSRSDVWIVDNFDPAR